MMTVTKFSNVSKSVLYMAKKQARMVLDGLVKDQYTILDDSCRQLTTTNPRKLFKSLMISDFIKQTTTSITTTILELQTLSRC